MSKYLREEYNKLKKKFKDRFNCCFNKYIKQYITKYKGIDYNNELNLKSINNVVKTLIINIKLLLVF